MKKAEKINKAVKALGTAVMYKQANIKITSLKEIPKSKCMREAIKTESFTLHVNMRTGQRLVEIKKLGIFDLGYSF